MLFAFRVKSQTPLIANAFDWHLVLKKNNHCKVMGEERKRKREIEKERKRKIYFLLHSFHLYTF